MKRKLGIVALALLAISATLITGKLITKEQDIYHRNIINGRGNCA